MKASDIAERESADLAALRDQLKKELFTYRMRNHTGQLDDNSLLKKTRRDIARINTILSQREQAAAEAAAAEAIAQATAAAATEGEAQ